MFKTEIKREKIRICEATKINDPDIRSAIPVATTSENAGRTASNRKNAQKALKHHPTERDLRTHDGSSRA